MINLPRPTREVVHQPTREVVPRQPVALARTVWSAAVTNTGGHRAGRASTVSATAPAPTRQATSSPPRATPLRARCRRHRRDQRGRTHFALMPGDQIMWMNRKAASPACFRLREIHLGCGPLSSGRTVAGSHDGSVSKL
jgi:hypothetical protein